VDGFRDHMTWLEGTVDGSSGRVFGKNLGFRLGDLEDGFNGAKNVIGYSLGTVYSTVNAASFNLLPSINGMAGNDVHFGYRPFIQAGRIVPSAESSARGFANFPTAGIGGHLIDVKDNFANGFADVGMNLGKSITRTSEPWQFARDAAMGVGFDNMMDYNKSFSEKGPLRAIAEMAGSSAFLWYGLDSSGVFDSENVQTSTSPSGPGGITGGKTGGIGAGPVGGKVGGIGGVGP
jgi:hypothetical protein